jgi:hypothetical protein
METKKADCKAGAFCPMANSIGFHGEDNGAEREPLSALAFCQVPPRHL